MNRGLGLTLTALAAGLSAASTPPQPETDDGPDDGYRSISFRIENQYAESIFSLSYEVELPPDAEPTETSGVVFQEVRIGGYGRETAEGVVDVPVGARIHPSMTGRSLGQEYTFDDLVDEDDQVGILVGDDRSATTLRLIYRYDVANASFAIGYGWGL